MRIGRLIERSPFVTWTVAAALLALVAHGGELQYDSGGLRGLLFWLTGLVCAPLFPFGELMMALNEGRSAWWTGPMSVSAALAVSWGFDRLLTVVRARRG